MGFTMMQVIDNGAYEVGRTVCDSTDTYLLFRISQTVVVGQIVGMFVAAIVGLGENPVAING